MAIDRLYYFGLSILALGFCCTSHYHMWPTKGYLPHQNVGNKARKDPKEQEEQKKQKEREKQREKQRKKEYKERKERKKGKPEERRRKPDSDRDRRHHHSDDDTPEWIADFSSKRKGGPRHAEDIPLSAPAKGTGRPGRVSFEDEQPPVVSREQNGNIANGYVPYEHIYGKGPAKTGAGRTNARFNSPPNATTGAVTRGRHNGNVKSPEGKNKQPVGSPPSSTNRSKHATVQSASDTISPPPVTDNYVDPGFRAFHGM
jgi:hypothetical protein